LLIANFPNKTTTKPKIYFKEQIKPIWPKNIAEPNALFYSPTLNPWANDMVKNVTGNNAPFFAFFHDLSHFGMLEQIVHEFTHYLQSIGQSSVSYDAVKRAADYYQFYYANKEKNKQIYIDSIHEVEARAIATHIHEQTKQLLANNNMLFAKDVNYAK